MRMKQVPAGKIRSDIDGFRRYRPMLMSFDTRAHILATKIEEDWETQVRAQWLKNQERLREQVLHEFGVHDGNRKLADMEALGSAPWSVVAQHNHYLHEIRDAFVYGAYYPALLGAAGLGERILNHLLFALKDDFGAHPATRPIAGKQTVDKWPIAIKVLKEWNVLPPRTASTYLKLATLRNEAIHYRRQLDSGARRHALEAIHLLQDVVQDVFNPLGGPPIFIAGVAGASFISLEAERLPLVRRFFIPASFLVSPRHSIEPLSDGTGFIFYDDLDYSNESGCQYLSDAEFIERFDHHPVN